MPPSLITSNWLSSSETGIKISIDISESLPLNIKPLWSMVIFTPVRTGIVVRDEIARSTSVRDLVNLDRLIVNFIGLPSVINYISKK